MEAKPTQFREQMPADRIHQPVDWFWKAVALYALFITALYGRKLQSCAGIC